MIKRKLLIASAIMGINVFFTCKVQAQTDAGTTPKKIIAIWDCMVIAGYVNEGAYLNFGGPCIKLRHKPVSLNIGFLPSIRIKEDKVTSPAKKNSIITPSLGVGLTFFYKHLALQMPLYYNPKSATLNGTWNIGAGIGYKF